MAPNDLTPCRMAFYFVSTFAIAQTPTKQPALRLSRTKNLHFAKAPFPGFSAEACASCHGEKGISAMGMFPSLAGQTANYTYKQLRDYADDKRENAMMLPIAKGLSEQDSADLAAWFASLPAAQNQVSKQDLSKAKVLVDQGNGKKILPPCFTCHGGSGEGQRMDTPALAGQQAEYTVNTLLEYKNGTRHNDIYSRMRLIAKQLSDAEIKQLGELYQQMK